MAPTRDDLFKLQVSLLFLILSYYIIKLNSKMIFNEFTLI